MSKINIVPPERKPPAAGPRRRAVRSDARRNVARILTAAEGVLRADPGASLEAVARAAGVTRQTVYAHFAGRDALIEELTDRATARVVAALDRVPLDDLPAPRALARVVETAWREFGTTALLGGAGGEPDDARHAPVVGRLRAIAERGHREGTLDASLPVSWVAATTVAVAHVAAAQVASGELSADEAPTLLLRTLERMLGPSRETRGSERS